MPVIRVNCLPEQTEDQMRNLHQKIVAAVTSISELGLKSQNDMTCLFPGDMMKYGLGEEIVVEVFGLFIERERTIAVRTRLAEAIGKAIHDLFPESMVEVFVIPFDQFAEAFWSSKGR